MWDYSYFFDSNVAVNGCVARSEPGYKHFEWLRRQLDTYRRRGMKVMIIGHVPPARVDSKADWVESCWQKYTLWQKQYRDIIVGSFYGHMNIDHFMLQDFKNIKKSVKKGLASARGFEETIKHEDELELDIMSARDYLIDLRNSFSKIPSFKANENDVNLEELYYNDDEEDLSWFDILGMIKRVEKKHGKKRNPLDKIGGQFGERYSLSFVAPSVVPNYFPTLRVFEYNITGLDDVVYAADASTVVESYEGTISQQMPIIAGKTRPFEYHADGSVDEEKKLKHRFKVPKAPAKSSPPGPAYSPQPLSLVKYTQYFANLTHINNDFANAMDQPDFLDDEEGDDDFSDEHWKEGKHKGKTKKGKPHPRKFAFHVEYDTAKDKIHGLKDLTVRSYIELAKLIGDSEKKWSNKSWHTFIQRAFVSAFDTEDLEEQFGGWDVSPSSSPTASKEEQQDDGASFEL
jgi:endopolyphosphatase